MLKHLIDFSLNQKFVAIALVILMGAGGVFSLFQLPINSLPDVTPVQVLVITKAGRYSPYDVERFVSFPIETTMNGLPDVKEVRSISQFGLSAVTVEFEEGTDIYFARQMVSQRLQSAAGDLPAGVSTPQLGPISTALGEIYQYVVKGDNYSLIELREIQDWLIAPQLKTIQGVTEINSFGGYVKQYEVEVKPGQLRGLGIGLGEVIDAISENNSVSGGNYLEHNREQYIIRGFGLVREARDIENIIVAKRGDRPIYVRDVADVGITRQLRQGGVTKDGEGEVVTGIVMMLRGGNGREVIQAIEEKIATVNLGLPEGVVVEKFYDQSDMVERTTSTVSTNLIEGGFFVVAVLLLLLGEIRGALIVASVIPLSMLFAFIGMREFGLAANLMSLGAIDFGMVVDGSVVMVENMVHRMQEEHGKRSNADIIRDAAHEVARPIFFGVLIILMVYVPIATFSGMEGILFRPMAITVATAVFGSLLLALVYVPALSALVFRKGVHVHRNYVMEWLRPRYRWLLEKSLNNRSVVIGIALMVFILSMFVMARLGTEFLPELDEGSILVEEIRMPSVTLRESIENANWLAGEIMRNIPEVRTVVPKTGRSDLANDWMGVHQTDVWVVLKPRDEWRSGLSKEDIIEEIRPFLMTEPGLAYNFTQPIAMRVDELTSGVKSDIAVKLFGEDLETLNLAGERITQILPSLPGTDNFQLEQSTGQPYLNIQIDRDAVAAYGINVNEVQQVIEAGIGGFEASEVYEGQRRFGIVVRYPENIRSSFREVMNVPVQLPSGDFIPLSRVAEITMEEGPREIARENGQRRVIVGINLRDIDIGTYVANLQEAIAEQVELPPGVFVTYGGAFEDQQRAMRHLLIVVPLVLFIIMGLLYVMFGKMRYAWLIFLNLPFALSGGVFLLWMRDLYLSVSASIGFVALFGVAVLNGIVLVSHLNALREKGLGVRQATLEGAADRLRPVLMTALVASLGFIPMAFNTGPGSEVQRPLATVVIGGLITATLLTLLVLPTIYNWIERDRQGANGTGPAPAATRAGVNTALVLLLLATSVVFAPAAFAQTSGAGDNRLTVQEAIDLAHQQNPALNNLREQIAMKKGERLSSYGIHTPTVSYMKEGINDGAFSEQRIGFSQVIDFPLTSYYRLGRNSIEQDALGLELEATTRSITAAVKKAYAEVLYAQEVVHLRQEEVNLAADLNEAAGIRVEVGEASELDLIKAELQSSEALSGIEEAVRQFQLARYTLFNVIGLDPDVQQYSIEFPDTLAYVPVDINQEEVLDLLEVQPAYESASRSLDAARFGIKQVRSTLLPALQFDYYPQDFGNGYTHRGFQIGLRLPLWVFPNHQGAMKVAKAEVQQQTWNQQAVYLNLKKRIEQAFHSFETSKATITRYNDAVRARAQELLARTREGYQVGEINLLTLLDTQRTYLASELRYYNALRDYYLHLIELEQFMEEEVVF